MIGYSISKIFFCFVEPKFVTTMVRFISTAICLSVFFLTIFLSGCSKMPGGNATENSSQLKCSEGEAFMENENSVSKMARPAINLAVPDKLETATLAMG